MKIHLPYLIALAGKSGVGKSTLARAISSQLYARSSWGYLINGRMYSSQGLKIRTCSMSHYIDRYIASVLCEACVQVEPLRQSSIYTKLGEHAHLYRELKQVIGTYINLGNAGNKQDLVSLFLDEASTDGRYYDILILDDVRLLSQLDTLQSKWPTGSLYTIHVHNPLAKPLPNHLAAHVTETETFANAHFSCDFTNEFDPTKNLTYKQVMQMAETQKINDLALRIIDDFQTCHAKPKGMEFNFAEAPVFDSNDTLPVSAEYAKPNPPA